MPAILVSGPTAMQNSAFFPNMAETIACTNCTYPLLNGLENTMMVDPPKVVTNLSTNRARHSMTLLTTLLPLCQTGHLKCYQY